MKKILLTLVCGFMAVALHAQIHIGATTAVNATFVLDKGLSDDPRYNSTYTYQMAPIGFSFGVNLGKKFGLSLESILSNQGQIYEIVNTAEKVAGERNIDLQYINIPMLMKFMSGGDGKARANFNFGPQLGLLTKAKEVIQYDAGTYQIPDDENFQIPDGGEDNGDGTYTIAESYKEEFTKAANNFKNTEFQLAAAFGLDIDLSKHLFLTTQIRANYSLSEMTNGDVIDKVGNGGASEILSSRANLLVGIQIGLHYSFSATRSFK